MPFKIYITKDFDQMSSIASGIVEADIASRQKQAGEYVLGLATGNTPTGLYKHLAKSFNAGRIDPGRVRSFNLDEYVGLPGENAQQRGLHRESYSFFMISELFGLLQQGFIETNVPWGTLIDQRELIAELDTCRDRYELQGIDKGKAIVIRDNATGVLGMIKRDVLDAYEHKIQACGGIDLHIIGVGGRGHVAFHESGIPFEGNRMLLVQLDDNTVANAVEDGHFTSRADSPQYAISMGAELVYQARTVVLLANGRRKTAPVAESILGPVTSDVPISYGQRLAEQGGTMVYVLDEEAGADVLAQQQEITARGYEIIDERDKPYETANMLAFSRDPSTGHIG
jgi:glucosamine-6-phosphate deaminase